jgi:predicted kinase
VIVRQPVLVVIRGNSASGKSSLAETLRARYGRGVAIVGQDLLRRQVLRERPVRGSANLSLIDLVARHALAHGFHTIVEGILEASVYGDMLATLVDDHRSAGGQAACYYLDVPLEETLRRHATKPIAAEVTEDQLRRWYLPRDTVPRLGEAVLLAAALSDAVDAVLADTRLLDSVFRDVHASWDDVSPANRWR